MLHKKPHKYKGGTGEEMTMDVLPISINSIHAATTNDEQGEVRSLHPNCKGYPSKKTKSPVYIRVQPLLRSNSVVPIQ